MNPGVNLDPSLLAHIETIAIELAQLGGNEIKASLGTMLRVRYKGLPEEMNAHKDPVSEVDRRVEAMIRERLGQEFPEHDIIGEEIDERPGAGHDFVWAVDPIDGTANFINGFPLFASSVGVLYRGRPIAGALWCSSSHSLEPGVYHAVVGRDLRFNGAPLENRSNPEVRRRLGGEPMAARQRMSWDGRKTGSAAIECAFVAAGLLDMAWFERPHIWDVAGGFALALASKREIMVQDGGTWLPFTSFEQSSTDLAQWSSPTALGRGETLNEFEKVAGGGI